LLVVGELLAVTSRTIRHAPWFVVCVAIFASSAGAAELTPIVKTLPSDRAESTVGLHLAAKALRLRGDVTAQSNGTRTFVAPQLLSTVAIAPKMSLETRLDFAEWNSQSALFDGATVETKFRVRSVLPLIDELEGRVWRSPDGLLRQSLRFGLTEKVGSLYPGRPILLRTSATIEETDFFDSRPNLLRTGVEAALTGFAPGRVAADNRLAVSYKTTSGANSQERIGVGYKRSWPINDFVRFGFDCELVDSLDESHRFKLYWQGKF
jgi:hypothetical protein